MITLEQYLGPWAEHADATPERIEAAKDLLGRVNALLIELELAGVPLEVNPRTQSMVSGHGLGGFRPQGTSIGAARSKHKEGRAVDLYDPHREIAKWCVVHARTACSALDKPDRLGAAGLSMEDPRWTPSWCHLQSVPPASGRAVFVPSNSPPLASALPGQQT